MNFLNILNSKNLLPTLVLIFSLSLWQIITMVFDISAFLLPSPLSIFTEALRQKSLLMKATSYSFLISLSAWCLSLIFGPLLGFILCLSPFCKKAFYPYAVLFQTIPIVAIAPLVILWLGPGWTAMISISFFVSIFPLITSSFQGLIQTPKNYLEMLKTLNASPVQTWLKLRLPASLPYLVSGAKTSAGLAVVGSVVGEYFTGISEVEGLAYIIRSSQMQVNYPLLFAASIMTAVLGICFCTLIEKLGEQFLERKHYGRF